MNFEKSSPKRFAAPGSGESLLRGNGKGPQHYRDSVEDLIELVIRNQGEESAPLILEHLVDKLRRSGLKVPGPVSTPYVNTIPPDEQPEYPGDREVERRIKSLIRWNAMAMVVNANQKHDGLGGHISSFASSATLYEVAQNHIFRGGDNGLADFVFFQGHATPGNYARAYLERRLHEKHLHNFRQELAEGGGLSSYPQDRKSVV